MSNGEDRLKAFIDREVADHGFADLIEADKWPSILAKTREGRSPQHFITGELGLQVETIPGGAAGVRVWRSLDGAKGWPQHVYRKTRP
jgi:hypothetical protein